MTNYHVRCADDSGIPFVVSAASPKLAAKTFAHDTLLDDNAVVYVWTERMWQYQLGPLEYYVWQVKNVFE